MVKLFVTPACPYCFTLKEFFKEHNIEFEEIDVSQDEKAREYLDLAAAFLPQEPAKAEFEVKKAWSLQYISETTCEQIIGFCVDHPQLLKLLLFKLFSDMYALNHHQKLPGN